MTMVLSVAEGRDVKYRQIATALVLVVPCALIANAGSASAGSMGTGSANPAVYRWGVPGSEGKIAQLELTTPTAVTGIEGKVVQIATSNSDGYALTSTGTVWAWGVDNYGELGNGTTTLDKTQAVQVSFPAGVRIVSLPNPMPFDGALAIDSHGDAWGWGLNASNDLCLPSLAYVRPHRIPLTGVTLATGARTHSLFYSHGQVYACGSGQGGALGDGSTADSAKPVVVTGLPRGDRVTTLTSSWEGSGALLSNGAYYDWGYDAAGQLGDGKTSNSDVPVRVDLPSAVRQVFQGGSGATNGQTIALLANGSVWAWGANKDGQLGDGSTTSSDVPVSVHVPAGVRFVAVNSGGYATYAIDSSGELWAWGGGQNGQLGTGGTDRAQTQPADVRIHLKQVSSTASNVAGLG
jgi:alpha-tubulin suppressor-like RCC1 family protein